ncbi:MAG TPA: S26 family signal peptidase [Bacilli bacterium]|nr:S26 family signal peptidase [Bacilli bacterium]
MLSSVKKKRLGAFLWSTIYFVLVVIFACSATLIFHSTYYRSIFVSGTSMSPTLYGLTSRAHFGIIDTTSLAKNSIKRFDIVTTYFPWDESDYSPESIENKDYSMADGSNPEYKIKRVVALPGETIFYFTDEANRRNFPAELKNHIIILESKDEDQDGQDDGTGKVIAIYRDKLPKGEELEPEAYTFTIGEQTIIAKELPYYRQKNAAAPFAYGRPSIEPTAVPEGRYFAMGDNWSTSGSTDCGTSGKPLYYDNIVGVLVAIEGTCTIVGDTGEKKCTNRQYSWPVIY